MSPDKLAALEAARAVVTAWDTALNRHDVTALARLYAPTVSFYSRRVSRAALLESKQKALAATPDYAQQLSKLNISPLDDGTALVSFDKRSGSAAGAQRSVPARLRLEKWGGALVIAVESDSPSDARADASRSCIDVAVDVAESLPAVSRIYANPDPAARPGGVTYQEEGDASAALGYHHDDRFEAIFYVNVEKGVLSVTEYGEPLPIPAEGMDRVRAKCLKH
ncbi:MAG: nuclear transport factor 2 family protein [Polyangiaceae bacterium]